ncbi:hypothetical protein ULMS_04770 [Patiriisocius marinistellae]|uniref:Type IX secretion system membrane protein PorP/SprF n=1 Tax=Patiriisocius marinistellae TaxID=2494560 RepID=A0A5J4FXX1_9FLAO|nr:hypothetical protein [Patiriisocius marinistellae]GEQ84969.1 hypothetical protein ULMS_04770 [Patiriisocius marinistellae]
MFNKKSCIKHVIFFALLVVASLQTNAQDLKFNGGLQLKATLQLGNQNQALKLGVFGFGTANYNDIAIETGATIFINQLFKRHTVKNKGIGYGYDLFSLIGIGQNSNLLGSSISNLNTTLIINNKGDGGFNGFGFGLEKEYLPNGLKTFSPKRGSILMRFSNANHSINIAFLNDFRFGQLARGEGTDYAATGTLKVSYSEIGGDGLVYQIGLGIALFTPKADFSKSPDNSVNSDDGRKNVWYTLTPFEDLFYSNAYFFGTVQQNHFSGNLKLGYNSQRLGAYIQNTLHDGPGLNPRFPWNVRAKDKLFIEIEGSLIQNLGDVE